MRDERRPPGRERIIAALMGLGMLASFAGTAVLLVPRGYAVDETVLNRALPEGSPRLAGAEGRISCNAFGAEGGPTEQDYWDRICDIVAPDVRPLGIPLLAVGLLAIAVATWQLRRRGRRPGEGPDRHNRVEREQP